MSNVFIAKSLCYYIKLHICFKCKKHTYYTIIIYYKTYNIDVYYLFVIIKDIFRC